MATKATTATAETTAPVFSKADLIANADALGYKQEVVAGALYTVQGDAITKDQLKKAVEDFLKKPVRKEGK